MAVSGRGWLVHNTFMTLQITFCCLPRGKMLLGILGVIDKTRRRPGDVSIRNGSFRRGLAIDVAIICPLAESQLGELEPCESFLLFNRMLSMRKLIKNQVK